MKTAIFLAVAALLSGVHMAAAQQGSATVQSEPGKAKISQVVDFTATIAGIDKATRTITLKGAQKTIEVVAGEDVRNFDQLQLGDKVNIKYQRALSMELQKTRSNAGPAHGLTLMQTAKPGEAPGGVVGRTVSVLAEVVAVDPKKSIISLKGPRGDVVDLQVQNPDHFKVVKKGDQVAVVYSEALAIAVTPVAATRSN